QNVTIVLGVYMGIALILLLSIFSWARNLAQKVEDPVYKQAILNISYYAIINVGVFVFFIIDSFYTDYTIWGLSGWSCYLIAVIAAYRGFIRPAKLAAVVS
ncbi:MAG TPA: hypothetical protein VKK79_18660, partial [Candidatus Lokiarchaeia archaeon]|nr:hypothetical protein [Candidatus Lokiarchaeia archaeon]